MTMSIGGYPGLHKCESKKKYTHLCSILEHREGKIVRTREPNSPSDTSLGFACLPYICGLSEPLTRLLRKNDILVVSKPAKTLQQEFPSPKFRQPLDLQCNVVYKIPCADCSWSYVGETGRCFKTRRKEHQQNLKNYTRGSNIANHAWQNNHTIDFDGATVIDKGNYRIRRTLESWHTAKTVGANNNSKP